MSRISPDRRHAALQQLKAARIARQQKWGVDIHTHHLLQIKEPPESLVQLRNRLQQPQHADISRRAQKFGTFEECIGSIAADLDIVLDGEYDGADLCELLVRALDARGTLGNNPSALDPRLVSAEIVEREKEVTLEYGDGTLAPAPQTDVQRFMMEHNCEVCENIVACKMANKCLGADALSNEAVEVAREQKEKLQ